MFLVYLSGLAPMVAKPQTKAPHTPAPAAQAPVLPNALEKPIFEFYDTLMNSEVISTNPDTNTQHQNDGQKTQPVYMLQAASFKKLADADSLKARLILEGLDVQLAEFNNRGEIYHRVMVGPFSDSHKMNEAKKTLATHQLTPIVLQKKL